MNIAWWNISLYYNTSVSCFHTVIFCHKWLFPCFIFWSVWRNVPTDLSCMKSRTKSWQRVANQQLSPVYYSLLTSTALHSQNHLFPRYSPTVSEPRTSYSCSSRFSWSSASSLRQSALLLNNYSPVFSLWPLLSHHTFTDMNKSPVFCVCLVSELKCNELSIISNIRLRFVFRLEK